VNADHTRMLTTLLFTDVVGSTDRLAATGDRPGARCSTGTTRSWAGNWRGSRGTKKSSPVTASSPPSRPRPRHPLRNRDPRRRRQIGLDVRVGIHTGEVERRRTELAGIAVHLAFRICDSAQPGEVLVTRTVVDLAAGSGAAFDDREHELNGIPAPWRLFAVTT
jgi:hypothetical protein